MEVAENATALPLLSQVTLQASEKLPLARNFDGVAEEHLDARVCSHPLPRTGGDR
jgi:hypothetical protein